MKTKLNFSLTQLEYVIAVHKYGHFAKAANACGITQPTLSMQIQKLEEEFNVTLFDRSKKPILLTDKGKKLIEQIQTVLYEAKKIHEIVDTDASGPTQGILSLGIIPTISPYLLPLLLPILEKSYPLVNLQISELQTQQIIDALDNDELDAGLLATPLNLQKIIEQPLFYEPFFVLCRKGHPLSQSKKVKYSELRYKDIWLLTEGHCLRHQALDICSTKRDKGSQRQFGFESGSLETLKNLVNSCGGYTLLPYLATESLGRQSHLIPFERPIPAREVGLVYRRKQHKAELIESLSKAIVTCIPNELQKIRPKDLDVLPVES